MEDEQLLYELLSHVDVDKLVEDIRIDDFLSFIDIDKIFSDEYRRSSAIKRSPASATGRVTTPTTTRNVEPLLSGQHVTRLENSFLDGSHTQKARGLLIFSFRDSLK